MLRPAAFALYVGVAAGMAFPADAGDLVPGGWGAPIKPPPAPPPMPERVAPIVAPRPRPAPHPVVRRAAPRPQPPSDGSVRF